MNVNLYEIIAFVFSVCTFVYAIVFLSKKEEYNKLFLYASGCYLLEELWVIVNSLFGHISGLLTVRLFGIFGAFCFLLTASVKQLEDCKNSDISIKRKSLIAPFLLLIIYIFNCIYSFSAQIVIGFVIILPMIIASYYNLKAVLLSKKYKKLEKNKIINMSSIFFYLLNFVYLFPSITTDKLILCIYDIFVTMIMFALIVLNKRSAYHE